MLMPRLSTKLKIALGYLLLTILLIAAIGYSYTEMRSLTRTDDYEHILSQRRRTTNEIINQLNRSEIIGQSLSIGQLGQYTSYKEAMQKAGEAVDSLRHQLNDSLQLTRLDTVSSLFREKERNMRNLLYIIRQSDTDALYQQHIEALINEQDSLLNLPYVRRKVVTHTHSYTVRQKPKSFFRRLGEVFVPSKKDSTLVSDTIQAEYIDSIAENYSPADTIATLLKDVQSRVADTQQQQMRKLNNRMQELRLNSLELNHKVHQLLATIEDEDQAMLRRQQAERESIRRHSANIVAGIALISILLAIIFWIIISRDITRSNHYRRELEKAKQRAENLLVAREKLMLTITHDIKAPVGSILGYTDLLERITTEDRQRFYLTNMQSSANHLLRLVNSLLDYHRLDADKMEVNPAPFNPHLLFKETTTSYRPMAEAKHLELHFECDKALDATFIGDPFRIRQITENLLSNALKFTSEGHVSLHVSWKEKALHLMVSDTGCGISSEERTKIFQEFTRLKNAQGEEGFGLGLAITQKLVHLLKGEIHLTSKQGKGSRFEVVLPLEKTSSIPATGDTTSAAIPSLRLLLIDDDRLQLQLTVAMLEAPNLSVTCCTHPDEVFKHLQESYFDLLLTDIQMPAMNGFDLLKAIRQTDKEIPVIALTARSDMDDAHFRTYGFAGCLHKPFTQKELLEVIAKTCPPTTSFDFTSLTAFSMDDPEAANEIMRTFIEETQKKRETLTKALNEKDMPSATAIAHQLLPLFRMLKAGRCINELLWLEERRTETDFPSEAEEKIRKVLVETGRIIEAAKKC